MSRLLFAALLALMCLGSVAPSGGSSSSNHLPAGLGMGDEPVQVNLNERFFDQVRALIKRRLQEKQLSKPSEEAEELPLPLVDDAVALQNQRSYDNVPIPAASVPTPVLVENWPTEQHSFGQVTAVAVDPQGNPVVFHRAERYWDVK